MQKVKMVIKEVKLEYNEYITSGNAILGSTNINAYVEIPNDKNDTIRVGLYSVDNLEKAEERLPKIKETLEGKEIYVTIDDEVMERHFQEYMQWTRGVSGNYDKATRYRFPTRLYNTIRHEIIGTRRKQRI